MNNYYTLYHLAHHFSNVLEDRSLFQLYTHQKNHVVLVFEHAESDRRDEIHVAKHYNSIFAFLQECRSIPGSNRLDFFESLYGRKIQKIYQIEDERAIVIDLEGASQLVMKLFGANFNIYHFYQGEIVDSFFKTKYLNGTLDDLFPPRSGSLKDNNIRQYLLSRNPKLPRVHLDDVLKSQGISIDDEPDEWMERIVRQLEENPCPRVTEEHEFTLFSKEFLPLKSELEYDSVNDGVRDGFYHQIYKKKFHDEKKRIVERLEDEINKLEQRLKSIQDEAELTAKSNKFEKFGHLLMSQPPGDGYSDAQNIEVDDLYEGGTITIGLKPKLNLHENAERYYKKAKSTRAAVDHEKRRKKNTEEELKQVRPVLDEAREISDLKQLNKFKKERSDWIKNPKKDQKEQLPYNTREIEGYTVWIGRNSKSNDKLTKQADKEDMWLHARGVGGSHVVIRMNREKEDPPKRVIEKVAALAAHYSKAKGMSLAPVIVTRKKYIRKPKGGNPGTFLVDQEEVIMVEPYNYQE